MAGEGYKRHQERKQDHDIHTEVNERSITYINIQKGNTDEMESEFVEVPTCFKGYVIGKRGCVINEIRQNSGARVDTVNEEEKGFTVSGDQEQRACAKKLISEKLEEIKKIHGESLVLELVPIPTKYKGLVIGKQGNNLKRISHMTGARVIRKDGEVCIVSGTEEERQKAKVHIKITIAGARMRGLENEFNKSYHYIDSSYLPADCKLKLKKVVQRDNTDDTLLPESRAAYYRLSPVQDYEPQDGFNQNYDPMYLPQLVKDTLEALNMVKGEIDSKEFLRADMWCHFGTGMIRGPSQVEARDGEWSIDEVTEKLRSSSDGVYWNVAFKEVANLEEKILEENVCDKTPEEYVDYAARHDLTFLTPSGHQIRFKVWVTRKNVGKRLEDIPLPLSDVKNILDEIQFKDEATRLRCRGWLVLPSRSYLQADILFPGCDFDCRLTVRGQCDSGLNIDYVPSEDETRALSAYLSEQRFTDGDEKDIWPSKEDLPKEFHLIYNRFCKRTQYEISPGFTVILSKERSWRSDAITEETRNSKDFYLRCREWDQLLSSREWKPENIVEKLPAFFRFVKKVQSLVLARTVPPEILARGPAAVEAYNKALLNGKIILKRLPLMLVGQDQAGKTSLKKSLRGISFNQEEDSTDGIDVDPSFFNVYTETWRTGEQDKGQTSDKVFTFAYQTARRIVDTLNQERKSAKVDTIKEEGMTSSDRDIKVVPDVRNTESSREAENIPKSTNPGPTTNKHPPSVAPDPEEEKHERANVSTSDVPDEVASMAETLLKSDWEDNEEDVYSTFWDFAGQSVYYVTHPLFLTKKAVYFLVYDLSLNPHDEAKPLVRRGVYKKTLGSFSSLKTNFDYLEFWMKSVASLASSQEEGPTSDLLPEKLPPVILVCTHADTPYNGRDPKDFATEIFGSLKSKPYGCHLHDVFFVDNTRSHSNKLECSQIQRLRREVVSIAKELPQTHDTIPIKWLKFERALQAAKKEGHKFISLNTAKDIAKVCEIDEEKEIETLMNYLHDLRSLIHFDDTAGLNNFVVLDPQWLVDVFKSVITVKPYDSEERKFLKLWRKLETEGILDEELLAHVWSPLFYNEETYQNLIAIMKKFSLLCPWPLGDSRNKSYLVPSMLRSHPPGQVLKLVETAKIPSLFIKFSEGQVPPDLFPRIVVQFFQWIKDKCQIPAKPQLFHEFARFFTSEDGDSVILICHSSVVEVVVHNHSPELAEHLSASLTLSEDIQFESTKTICASAVHRQLTSILERMHNETRWQRDMRYEMSFLCPVCSRGGVIAYCGTHDTEGCKEEECLHFLAESELRGAKKKVTCFESLASDTIVQVEQFSQWFSSPTEQEFCPSNSDGSSTIDDGLKGDPKNFTGELGVALLASEWNSTKGGLSTLNRELSVFLAKDPRIKVTLLVPEGACSEEDEKAASEKRVAIWQAKRRPGFDPIDWLSFPPKESDLAIDIILGHGAKIGKYAQIIKEAHNCKWVQMVHTEPEELGKYKVYAGAIGRGELKNTAEVDLCKLADLVVAVGPKLKETYLSYLRPCENNQDVIQLTPGTFDEFKAIKQASQERDKFKVLIFGRCDPEDFELKGYDIASKAVAELRGNYCLIFVGASEREHEKVEKRLRDEGIPKDRLIVRGFMQSREKLKDLLCEVDLAIMPSRTEGFGLTALEALSAGLPILVSGNSGVGHALCDLPLGKSFVVESEDPKDWAKAIDSVRQKERAQRLQEVQSLRASYEEKYSWEKQCGLLVERLLSLAYET